MDAFEYLKDDGAHIGTKLSEIADNYSKWPQDRVFAETKNVLQSLREHLDKEKLLVSNLKATKGIEDLLDQSASQIGSIVSEIDNLVMIHVDELGFEEGLESISSKWNEHEEFCERVFYPAIKQRLSKKNIERINAQLEQLVFS
jgi:hypothetical protein